MAMGYVEGFVLAVPAENKDLYRQKAEEASKIFKKHGATRLVECWGDDVPEGEVTDFRGAVKATDGEVVMFSWIEYPSKAVRDSCNAAMMEEMGEQAMNDMPFDAKRMIFGGFAPMLDLSF